MYKYIFLLFNQKYFLNTTKQKQVSQTKKYYFLDKIKKNKNYLKFQKKFFFKNKIEILNKNIFFLKKQKFFFLKIK